jgi:putative ABC transport system permease protein
MREIGLRIAPGATQSTVRAPILTEGMSLVVTGAVIGMVPALVVAGMLRTLLFGVGVADPISLAGAAVTLFGVALVACYVPARWATRVDPSVALRQA